MSDAALHRLGAAALVVTVLLVLTIPTWGGALSWLYQSQKAWVATWDWPE